MQDEAMTLAGAQCAAIMHKLGHSRTTGQPVALTAEQSGLVLDIIGQWMADALARREAAGAGQ